MSDNLVATLSVLEIISQIKSKKLRDAVLTDLRNNKFLYKALREISQNLVNRNIKITEKQKRRLRRHKDIILSLAGPKITKRKRAKLVKQSGGFLPILVPIVSAIIAEIANGAR